jgi:hypothetical protein
MTWFPVVLACLTVQSVAAHPQSIFPGPSKPIARPPGALCHAIGNLAFPKGCIEGTFRCLDAFAVAYAFAFALANAISPEAGPGTGGASSRPAGQPCGEGVPGEACRLGRGRLGAPTGAWPAGCAGWGVVGWVRRLGRID